MSTSREVPMICFSVGHDLFAVEVARVSSLVSPDEAEGIELVDLAEIVGLTRWRTSQVAFLDRAGFGIVLGEDAARIEVWDITRIAALPPWISATAPSFFKPVCGMDRDGNLVWVLDTDQLVEASRKKDES